MNKKFSEIFEHGDEIVAADEISKMFDPEEIKEITMKKIHADNFKGSAHHLRKVFRRVSAAAVAACLALALAVTAYAANFLGIRELWRTPNRELPEGAAVLIEQRGETAAAAEGWSARITESLCDSSNVMVSITVSGGGRYIVAPTDAAPDDPVSVIGLGGAETLAEYAAARGKKLLLAGAALEGTEGLGIFAASQAFQNLSDGDMAILIHAKKSVSAPSFGAVCTVYALEAKDEKVQRVELPFTLTETPFEALEFTPTDPDAIPGLRIGNATVTATPLGINVTFPVSADSDAALYDVGKMICEELSDMPGGFVGEDGTWYAQWTMGQGTVDDTLTVHFYDENAELIADVVFMK